MSFSEIDDALWESIGYFVRRYDRLYVERNSPSIGSKSTIHSFHLYLCEHGTYQKIFNELLNKGYDLNKIDLSNCFTDTKDIPAKRGNTDYDGYKKVKE